MQEQLAFSRIFMSSHDQSGLCAWNQHIAEGSLQLWQAFTEDYSRPFRSCVWRRRNGNMRWRYHIASMYTDRNSRKDIPC